MREFTFVDLCGGIGGFHLALKELGGECLIASEIDKYAQQTYKANFPDTTIVGDLTIESNQDLIPHADILCAGFPCQPFSIAGKQKGLADSRGNIFFSIIDIINKTKPRVILLENVAGLLNHDNGRTYNIIAGALAYSGYHIYHNKLNSKDFGVPQNRERLFIVAFHDDLIPNITGFSLKGLERNLEYTMSHIFRSFCTKDIGYTIRVGGRNSGINDKHNWDSYMTASGIKTIGVAEAKKMMGFPDNFIFPVSESQAMKQLGNSVVVPLIKIIGQQIIGIL